MRLVKILPPTISMGFEDGPESKPSGIISIIVGSLMIQLA